MDSYNVPEFVIIAIVCIVGYLAVAFVVNRQNAMQLKRLRDERLRLEKVVSDYNRLFNDDYKPF